MKVEIICIGDELLIGQVVNTNASWLASKLTELGFWVEKIVTVSDKYDDIFYAFKSASENVNLVIVTGGLGPTNDDITKTVLCDFFKTKLIRDKEIEKHISTIFSKRNLPVTELNLQQADLPEKCEVLFNELGTAPGMAFMQNDFMLVSLPGVPFEMKNIFEKQLVNYINKSFSLPQIVSQNVMTSGIAESFLAERIQDWESKLADKNLSLAYLPQPGIVRIRITANQNCINAKEEIDNSISELYKIIPDKIFAIGDTTLEEVIGKILTERNKTVSTAESCTGGTIAQLLTSVSGSSKYFKGSIVAYSNEIKTEILKVKSSDIEKYGAVSENVVLQMSENIRKIFKTDYAIAVSGIAGPDGGTAEKPVGTVWIAIASEKNTIAHKFTFGNDRARNILRASVTALDMLRKSIID
ncbi:MAG: competence/damage-inducible protein A [Bacteroidia bacterium]|nr:competence/damage-inducible protein A [Bacteroidia bacterium]